MIAHLVNIESNVAFGIPGSSFLGNKGVIDSNEQFVYVSDWLTEGDKKNKLACVFKCYHVT